MLTHIILVQLITSNREDPDCLYTHIILVQLITSNREDPDCLLILY